MQALQQIISPNRENLTVLSTGSSAHSNTGSAGMPLVYPAPLVPAPGKENQPPVHHAVVKLLASADVKGTLLQAAKAGDLPCLQALLAIPGISITACNAALIAAARKGHGDSVQMLLTHPDIQINARDENGNTALIWAARNGHMQVAGDLLKQAAINPLMMNYAGMDALAAAAELGHPGMMRTILSDQRTASHACSEGSFAALRAAASKGHLAVLQQLLLPSGIDVNRRDENGCTLLIIAAEAGRLELLEWLLWIPDVDINLRERHGATALILAAANGHDQVVGALLEESCIAINAANALGETALICAVANNHRSVVSRLLESDETELSLHDQAGNTALIVAASKGYDELVALLLNDCSQTYCRKLINSRNIDNDTALTKAVDKGHLGTVKLLIKTGVANTAARNTGKKSAISIAAANRQFAMLRALLVPCASEWREAIDRECMDAMGLAMARKDRETIREFLSCRTLPETEVNGRARRLMCEAANEGNHAVLDILLTPPLVDYYQHKGPRGSALLHAARAGHAELVRKLLNIGVNVNTADTDGCTVLMHAAMKGQLEVMETLLQVPGIHVERLDNQGYSALSHAAQKSHEAGAALLISSRRVNPNRHIKKRPLVEWAVVNGITWFVQMLLDAGAFINPEPIAYAKFMEKNPSLKKDVVKLLNLYQQQRRSNHKPEYEILHDALYPSSPAPAKIDSAASTRATRQNPAPSLQELALQKTCAAIVSGICEASSVASLLQYDGQIPGWYVPALTKAVALAFVAGHCRDARQQDQLDTEIASVMTPFMHKTFLEAKVMFEEVKQGIDRYTKDGYTPLTRAARRGDINMIDLVLALGANIDLPDCGGDNALKEASSAAKWQAYVHLVNRQANPANFLNNSAPSWRDALVACRSGPDKDEGATEALLAALAIDPNLVNKDEATAMILAAKMDMPRLLERLCTLPGIDLNFKDNQAASALLWAAFFGNIGVVHFLLRTHGVDLNIELDYKNDGADSGDTPLIAASYRGHTEIVRMLLKKHGIKINHQNRTFRSDKPYIYQRCQLPNNTALMHAAQFGHIDIVKELLAASDIDPFIRNHAGLNAAQIARAAGHDGIAKYIAASAAKRRPSS